MMNDKVKRAFLLLSVLFSLVAVSPPRLLFSPFWGLYVGDTVSTSYVVGTQVAFYLNRHFATAVDFGYSPLETDPQSAYGSTVTYPHLFHVNGSLMGRFPASLHLSKQRVLEMDLYGLLGAGWLHINRSELPNGFLGVGGVFYLKRWFALRAEARTTLYNLPISPGGFSVDAAFLLGPTFLFGP